MASKMGVMCRNYGLAASILILSLSGCATFSRDYEQAVSKGAAPGGIEGAWEGRWQSESGHGGDRLQAILTRNGGDTIHARFRAKFWGIFEIEEMVDLHAAGDLPVRATREADLGWLKGGVYRYDATITPTQFDATYESKHDHGLFNLKRPQ